MSRYDEMVSDSLVILKNNDKVETHDDMLHSLYLDENGVWSPYNCDSFVFNADDFSVLDSFSAKLRYAFASLHEDTMVLNTLKEIIPEVMDVELPNKRFTKAPNLQNWMKDYGFTLKEFLTEKKYVVCADFYYANVLTKLSRLGLLQWDNFEAMSSEDEFD